MKKLYRSKYDRTLAGIFGGLGHYFNIDPVILRVIFIIFTICTLGWVGITAYIVLIFVIPTDPNEAEYIPPKENGRQDRIRGNSRDDGRDDR